MKILLLLLILIPIVNADTSYPIPANFAMENGDEAGFEFQVQNFRGENQIECTFEVQEDNGLELTFPENVRINAGSRMNVKGVVRVPRDLDIGKYTATFCSHCQPLIGEVAGSSVRQSDCGLPVNVDVMNRVEDGRRRFEQYMWQLLIGAIAIVIPTIVVIYVWLRKRRRENRR